MVVVVRSFDEFAVDEGGCPHDRDQVWPLTARQRSWATSMSLNAIASPAVREPGPRVILVQYLTVAKASRCPARSCNRCQRRRPASRGRRRARALGVGSAPDRSSGQIAPTSRRSCSHAAKDPVARSGSRSTGRSVAMSTTTEHDGAVFVPAAGRGCGPPGTGSASICGSGGSRSGGGVALVVSCVVGCGGRRARWRVLR